MNFLSVSQSAKAAIIVSLFLLFSATGQTTANNKTNNVTAAQTPQTQSADYKYILGNSPAELIKQLNELGSKGYKLESVTKFPLLKGSFNEMSLAAIVKLSKDNLYEYDWFEAYTPGEVVTRMTLRTAKGFRLRDSVPFTEGFCDGVGGGFDDSTIAKILREIKDLNSVYWGRVFFLERQNNINTAVDFRFITAPSKLGEEPTARIQTQIDDLSAEGFRPVGYFLVRDKTPSSILLEKFEDDQKSNSIKPQFKFIRSGIGKKYTQNIDSLAKKGFQIIHINQFFAVLSNENNSSNATSYKWFNPGKKSFPAELGNLSMQGAKYRIADLDSVRCDYYEGKLVFEQQSGKNDEKYEYKTLKMRNKSSAGKKEEETEKSPPSVELLENFEQIIDEGYAPRDLFYDNGIVILFERLRL